MGSDARATLTDYSLVHYDADPEKVRALLPPEVRLATFDVGGRERALLGCAAFHDALRLPLLPLRVPMAQVTFRTYGRHEGRDVAWFFGTTLTGPGLAVARLAWRLPWHRARTRFDCSWQGDRLGVYRMQSASRWGPAELEATGTGVTGPAAVRLGQRPATRRELDVLTHPTLGLFRRLDGRLGAYAVSHPPLRLEAARAVRCRHPVYERMGLVAPGQAPLHVLAQRQAAFIVHLPPRPLP